MKAMAPLTDNGVASNSSIGSSIGGVIDSAAGASIDAAVSKRPRFLLRRHLNKLRWLCLSLVFAALVLLPMLHVYQSYVAAHAYDLLSPPERTFYDVMAWITQPFTDDPAADLDAIKGNTWSATLFGLQLSDPLAIAGHIAATLSVYWPFVLSAAIPLVFTLVVGRFYCGWICPATFLYELNTNVGLALRRLGLRVGNRRFDRRLKYLVLVAGLVFSALSGAMLMALVYPPAIVGREIYYGVAQGAFGTGIVFFVGTLAFDLLVARRGFCRYLCPGGALYSLIGRFRALRIQRDVAQCNDCTKCNGVCEFGLDPMRDDFGQECNNCTACIAVCPTDALHFELRINDQPAQGAGILGPLYRRRLRADSTVAAQ
jgi:ferredoxin-type protein NapH